MREYIGGIIMIILFVGGIAASIILPQTCRDPNDAIVGKELERIRSYCMINSRTLPEGWYENTRWNRDKKLQWEMINSFKKRCKVPETETKDRWTE